MYLLVEGLRLSCLTTTNIIMNRPYMHVLKRMFLFTGTNLIFRQFTDYYIAFLNAFYQLEELFK